LKSSQYRSRLPNPPSRKTLRVELLEHTPALEAELVRPVEEVEIDRVEPEPFQRRLEGTPRSRALVLVPELGRHPNRSRREPAGPDRRADVDLVPVRGGRVDVPIPGAERGLDGRLRGPARRDLVDAEAQLRDRWSVPKLDRRLA